MGRRRVAVSNVDKPLHPCGFTKGEALEYYLRVAPVAAVSGGT